MENKISKILLKQFVEQKRQELEELAYMLKLAQELGGEEVINELQRQVEDLNLKYKQIRVHQLIQQRSESIKNRQ
jgi:uncharacterized protein YihD (DUF1040 family)